MLFVSGKQVDDFNAYLNKCWDECPIVALFLAVSTFDWVARRLLLAIGLASSIQIRKVLDIPFDIINFETTWEKMTGQSISGFVHSQITLLSGDAITQDLSWDQIKKAYEFAQLLKLEAEEGNKQYIQRNVGILFDAVRLFDAYTVKNGIDLSKQICRV